MTDLDKAKDKLLSYESEFPTGTEWVHSKTGNSYVLFDYCIVEKNLEPAVIYHNADGNYLWCRPAVEFFEKFVMKYPIIRYDRDVFYD